MTFKELSKEAFDALTSEQQEFYMTQLKAHKEKELKEKIDEAVKAASEAAKEQSDKEVQEKIDSAVKVVKDEADAKVDAAIAQMNRAKEAHDDMRGLKTISDEIEEKFSTEDGEKMLKDFLHGQRHKLNMNLQSKAVVKPTGANGSGVAPHFAPIVGPGHDTFHARQAIPIFPTSSDLIKYVQMTVASGAEGFKMTAEGTKKGVLNYTPTVKEAPVRKLAGILDISDEFQDDIVGMRAFLAYELPQAYFDAEDAQIFKGAGTGQNLLGLWTQAANQTFPQGTVTAASNTWDKIAAGITEVRKSKRNSTAVYLSPADYMNLLINKDDGDAYTYPIIMGNDNILRIAGIPILWSNVFADGEGLVGDFARGAAIFQRQEMNIRYFEENNDNVEKNLVTIRLEGREALPIYYPESFKKLILSPATT